MQYAARLNSGAFRRLCTDRGWTIADFSAESGISQQTVYRVLAGAPVSAGFIATCAVLFTTDEIPALFNFSRTPVVDPKRPERRAA